MQVSLFLVTLLCSLDMKALVYTTLATLLVLSKAAARPFADLKLDPHQLASRGLLATRAIACTNSSVVASATYTGSNTTSPDVRLRISNGGGELQQSPLPHFSLDANRFTLQLGSRVLSALWHKPTSTMLLPTTSPTNRSLYVTLPALTEHLAEKLTLLYRSIGSLETRPTLSITSRAETPTLPSPTTLKPSTGPLT